MTNIPNLNSIEKLERRVDVSAEISDYVYKYEEEYTNSLKEEEQLGNTPQLDTINQDAIDYIKGKLPLDTQIIDAMYDRKIGVAAIAVDNIHVEPGKVFIFPDKTSRLFRTL